MNKKLKARIKKIKVLALDVDGVLTRGDIVINSDGSETKIFNVQDGYAIVLCHRLGFKTAIISARSSSAVTHRAQDLKINRVFQDAYPKMKALQALLTDLKVSAEEVCFVGDDLPDLKVIEFVGFGVTVANGAPELKKVAQYVTKRSGGDGAVREVVELILKTQGKWGEILNSL